MSTPNSKSVETTTAGVNATPQEEGVIYVKAGSSIPKNISVTQKDLIDYGYEIPSYETGIQIIAPKGSTAYGEVDSKLARRSSRYIVPYQGKFYYYKMGTPARMNDNIWRANFPPGIVREGFVVIDRELYYVTLGDLKRGVIRSIRHVPAKKTTLTYDDFCNNDYRTKERTKTAKQDAEEVQAKPNTSKDIGDRNIQGFDQVTGVGDDSEADLVYKEQELTLLHTLLEEEGYEIVEAEAEENS